MHNYSRDILPLEPNFLNSWTLIYSNILKCEIIYQRLVTRTNLYSIGYVSNICTAVMFLLVFVLVVLLFCAFNDANNNIDAYSLVTCVCCARYFVTHRPNVFAYPMHIIQREALCLDVLKLKFPVIYIFLIVSLLTFAERSCFVQLELIYRP